MKVLHFTHATEPEYIVLITDDESCTAGDHAKPGYELHASVEYELMEGPEHSLPMDVALTA